MSLRTVFAVSYVILIAIAVIYLIAASTWIATGQYTMFRGAPILIFSFLSIVLLASIFFGQRVKCLAVIAFAVVLSLSALGGFSELNMPGALAFEGADVAGVAVLLFILSVSMSGIGSAALKLRQSQKAKKAG